MSSFSVDRLVAACRVAIAEGPRAVHEVVAEVVSDAASIAAALGERRDAGLVSLYRAPDLTVIDFAWAPWMCMKPHNHNMWSVVGLIAGREDNVFWRRTEQGIEAAGARSLGAGEVATLGVDIIHSVTNPIGKFTRAVHVYGGDFFAPVRPRSEWDHETLVERPWNMDDTRRLFAEAQARASLS
jgi:predicted metal-dependent enzyme (double-stranded beta helix superfamily)